MQKELFSSLLFRFLKIKHFLLIIILILSILSCYGTRKKNNELPACFFKGKLGKSVRMIGNLTRFDKGWKMVIQWDKEPINNKYLPPLKVHSGSMPFAAEFDNVRFP